MTTLRTGNTKLFSLVLHQEIQCSALPARKEKRKIFLALIALYGHLRMYTVIIFSLKLRPPESHQLIRLYINCQAVHFESGHI